MSRSGHYARCSCTPKAGSRSTTSIACWVQAMHRFLVCMRPAQTARADCCSKATVTILAGRLFRAGGQVGMQHLRSSARARSDHMEL